ncbi:MAG TPA: sugar phosphate nucleotidyltransferase [Patescibacteria group bacterium]
MKIVIFCGGHGTRLWPISRVSFPKPFVPLLKEKSLFQITYERYRKDYSPKDIFISTEDKYLKFVKEQAPEVPKENIILEPERRDTLAAYGLVTIFMNKRFPGEPVLFSWAKHLIRRERVFLDAVKAAGKHTKETGVGVSIDSKPEFPSVNNGWVKKGTSLGFLGGSVYYKLEKQVEKPELALAKRLFLSGSWLIHTGYKVWDTEKLLGYYKQYQPEMYKGLMKISAAMGTKLWKTELYRQYHAFPKTSIDYGILEKLPADSFVTLEADMGWEDVGISWETYYKGLVTSTLKDDTVEEGGVDTEYLDAERNLVIGTKGKMIGIVGVSDIAVIDTPDGLLICKLSDSQKVKKLYEMIEKKNSKYVD